MNVSIRRLGEHRGAPRLYIDTVALEAFGFEPGASFSVHVDDESKRVRVTLDAQGTHRVSQKRRPNGKSVPVIDLNSTKALALLAGAGLVRVVMLAGCLHVLAVASARKALQRLDRLEGRIEQDEPLRIASVAFGAGVTASAVHEGLATAGIRSSLCLVDEISPEYIEVALANNKLVTPATVVCNMPMQEAVADDWLVQKIGTCDLLELGIPCSGASRAGAAKRGLKMMEDHPVVGHLVASVIQWIAALQPALILAENVVPYRDTASASILRRWLKDAGYAVTEMELDARDFGSLEARVRWFLVAHPSELNFDVESMRMESSVSTTGRLSSILDDVPLDDASYRRVEYLQAKEKRDLREGKGFRMQLLEATATEVPTLRKGYHKGGSTDPRIRHPFNPELSRLMTPGEHAKLKAIDESLIQGLCSTIAHQVCGQSVDTRPVKAIGRELGKALRRLLEHGRAGVGQRSAAEVLQAVG